MTRKVQQWVGYCLLERLRGHDRSEGSIGFSTLDPELAASGLVQAKLSRLHEFLKKNRNLESSTTTAPICDSSPGSVEELRTQP